MWYCSTPVLSQHGLCWHIRCSGLTDPNPGHLTGRPVLRLQCAQVPILGQPTAPKFGYSQWLTVKSSRASRGESAGKTKRWLWEVVFPVFTASLQSQRQHHPCPTDTHSQNLPVQPVLCHFDEDFFLFLFTHDVRVINLSMLENCPFLFLLFGTCFKNRNYERCIKFYDYYFKNGIKFSLLRVWLYISKILSKTKVNSGKLQLVFSSYQSCMGSQWSRAMFAC